MMLQLSRGSCLVVVVSLAAAGPVGAWERGIKGPHHAARAIASDAEGNLVAGSEGANFSLVKLEPKRGSVLWHYVASGAGVGGAGQVWAIAIDPAGDVVATGFLRPYPTVPDDLFVVKVDGATGQEEWRRSIKAANGTFDQGRDVVVDPAGDVFVVGEIGQFLFAAKFAGADGAEIWRQEILGVAATNIARGADLDENGNLVVAGEIDYTVLDDDFIVLELDGTSGAELWRREIATAGSDRAWALAVDSAGDVIACGKVASALFVTKLDGGDGHTLWDHSIADDSASAACRALTLTASGDAIAAGTHYPAGERGVIWRLDGTTGAEMWRTATGMHRIGNLALAEDGNPVLTGQNVESEFGPSQDMSAIEYDADTGAQMWHFATGSADGTAWQVDLSPSGDLFIAGEPRYASRPGFTVAALRQKLAGGKLAARSSSPGAPISRLRIRSADRGSFAPRAFSAADPRVSGASLELRNPTSGEVELISLSDGNRWHVMGPSGSRRGYVYRDRSGLPGTCRRVTISASGKISAFCRAAAFTLDEAAQGTLAVKITLGTTLPFCMEFGGTIRTDVPTRFNAARSDPPATCD